MAFKFLILASFVSIIFSQPFMPYYDQEVNQDWSSFEYFYEEGFENFGESFEQFQMEPLYDEMEADYEAEHLATLAELGPQPLPMIMKRSTRRSPLLLVLQWPIVFGKLHQERANISKISRFSNWTLHGLWPNGDVYCDRSAKLSQQAIEPLRDELKADWPNFARYSGPHSNADVSFWSYQWTKHGSCTEMEQRQYFRKAEELFDQYPIESMLEKADIVPDDQKRYTQEEITQTLSENIGEGQFVLRCAKDNWLQEIFLCFDGQGEGLINCPGDVRGNCEAEVRYFRTM